MSRTYRKTKSKRGAPKWTQRAFTKQQLTLVNVPPPKRQPNKYALVHEVVLVDEDRSAPTSNKDPRWCTKGQPGAIPEYITEYKQVIRYVSGIPGLFSWPVRKESGRYYLPKPATTVEMTRRKRVREPINWMDESWRLQWDHQEVFDHVHRNRCWRRDSSFEKYMKRRELRNEGREIVRKWEDEYHLNEHLLPYNWVLDGDDYDFDDIFDEDYCYFDYEPDWRDDGLTYDECSECGRKHSKCICDDHDGYDWYESDPWIDDYYTGRGSHYGIDRRNAECVDVRDSDVQFESGKSLGDILTEIQRHKEA